MGHTDRPSLCPVGEHRCCCSSQRNPELQDFEGASLRIPCMLFWGNCVVQGEGLGQGAAETGHPSEPQGETVVLGNSKMNSHSRKAAGCWKQVPCRSPWGEGLVAAHLKLKNADRVFQVT